MRFFLSLLFIIAVCSPAMAQKAMTTKHDPNVELWLPPDFQENDGPWPMIIFSHGFGGCAKQSTFLTSNIADQGYIVVAPDHKDARPCSSVRAYEMASQFMDKIPEVPFREPAQWSEETYAGRRDDIIFTLASILDDPRFKGVVDEDRIGLMGHSLGGYTALGMAGGWPSWTDKRFKAVLAMSPYVGPFIAHKTLGKIRVPVFYMGGTQDKPATPILKARAWPQANAPKYLLEISGAGHSSFTQRDRRFESLINAQVLAFFDLYLKGKDVTIAPGKAKGVAEYREDVGK